METEEIIKNDYCVYMHTSPSNKKYIGITSQQPERRWKNGYGYIHNEYFSRAIEKYGWDNFKHEILEKNLSLKEAYEKEQNYIAQYNTYDRNCGYNLTRGGDGVRGLVFSEETLKRMSEAFKGENNPFYGKHHSEETKRKLSEHFTGLLVGKSNPNYGNYWSEEQRKKASEYWIGNIITEETRKKMSLAHENRKQKQNYSKEEKDKFAHKEKQSSTKRVRCIELNIEFPSLNECARYFGVSVGRISVAAHRGTKCCGYHFEIISNDKYIPKTDRPIVQLALNMEFVKEYKNSKIASQENNISFSGINNVLEKRQRTSGGFIWMYADEYYEN